MWRWFESIPGRIPALSNKRPREFLTQIRIQVLNPGPQAVRDTFKHHVGKHRTFHSLSTGFFLLSRLGFLIMNSCFRPRCHEGVSFLYHEKRGSQHVSKTFELRQFFVIHTSFGLAKCESLFFLAICAFASSDRFWFPFSLMLLMACNLASSSREAHQSFFC